MKLKTVICIALLPFLFSGYNFRSQKIVNIDVSSSLGSFKMLIGTQGKPYNDENHNFISFYNEFGFKIIRNHDYYGPTDWYTIFPDWNADPSKPSSYNFKSSDSVLIALHNGGLDILFRLGPSWKGKHKFPSNDPPGTVRNDKGKIIKKADLNDFKKFADICKHIVMHYNDGWAGGHYLNIKKWEIWNEPSLASQFWSGDYIQFRQLFAETALALKKYDASLHIGGPASEGMNTKPEYIDSLLTYCKSKNVKLDFYSFHTYGGYLESLTPYEVINKFNFFKERLEKYGYPNAELVCSEYNCGPSGKNSNTPKAAAFVASFLHYSEICGISESYFYRADDHPMGLLNMKNYKEKYEAFSFLAWKVLTSGNQRISTAGSSKDGFTVTASKNQSENKIYVLISNFPNADSDISLVLEKLNKHSANLVRKEISVNRKLSLVESKKIILDSNGSLVYNFICPGESVQFIELEILN